MAVWIINRANRWEVLEPGDRSGAPFIEFAEALCVAEQRAKLRNDVVMIRFNPFPLESAVFENTGQLR